MALIRSCIRKVVVTRNLKSLPTSLEKEEDYDMEPSECFSGIEPVDPEANLTSSPLFIVNKC